MRWKRAGAAVIVAAAGLAGGRAGLSPPAAHAAGPLISAGSPGSPRSATASGTSDPVTGAEAAPGACPSGGLIWTINAFRATAMDSSAQQWLVQESGQVSNSSPATIIIGDGAARVGRRPTAPSTGPVVDVPLTPTGSLELQPGGKESFSGAIIIDSAIRPTNLGAALSSATWQSPALLDGCPPPSGAATGSGTLLSASLS